MHDAPEAEHIAAKPVRITSLDFWGNKAIGAYPLVSSTLIRTEFQRYS